MRRSFYTTQHVNVEAATLTLINAPIATREMRRESNQILPSSARLHGSEKGPGQSNHSIREKRSEVLDAVRSFLSSVELFRSSGLNKTG